MVTFDVGYGGSCDVQRRTNVPFGIQAWVRHKMSALHLKARGKAQVSDATSSVRKTPQYADFAAAMMESIEKDTDYLVLYRQKLQKRAKEEVQTKRLIQSLALLVTEQQEDVETLRDEVDNFKQIVKELRQEIKTLAEESARLRKPIDVNKSTYLQNPDSRFIEIEGNSDIDTTPLKSLRPSERNSFEPEIDMFDEDIQFMQID